MAEPAKKSSDMPHVDHLLDAPVIYFDSVPNVGMRGPILNAVLAVHVGEPKTSTTTSDHVVAVANLRLTLATAARFRDLLDKMLLAARVTPGFAN
jgi:hypothetical protein